MDNVNTKDIESFEHKMEEKYSGRDSEKMGYQEFKKEFAELVEKGFHYRAYVMWRLITESWIRSIR